MLPHKVHVRSVTVRPDGLVTMAVRPPEGTKMMRLVYNAAGKVLAVLLAADDETLERMSEAVMAVLD